MKFSHYGHFLELNGKCYCLSLSKFDLVEVSHATLQYALRGDFEKIPAGVLSVLKDALIVVPSNIDELCSLRASLFSKRFISNLFRVTIAPTMLCNFACPYCFESSEIRANGRIMSDATAANIIKSVDDCFNKTRFKRMVLCWYGGEPLLGLKKVVELTTLIGSFAERNGVKLSTYIITNGSLLSADTAKTLIDCGIQTAQVTMDGAPEVHNSRRVAKDGRPTFDIILNNIEKALELGLKIKLRVNLDRDNVPTIFDLFDILKDRKIYKEISLSIGCVSPDEYGINDKILSKEEYNKIRSDIIRDRYGSMARNETAVVRETACSADSFNSLSVGPEGELYSCWEHFGDKDFVIGNVNDGDFMQQKLRNAPEYMTYDPTKIEECSKCKLLPMCFGGCPYCRIRCKPTQCHEWKSNIEESVRDYVIAILNKKLCESFVESSENC